MHVICEISKQLSIHMNFGNSAKMHSDRVHRALSESVCDFEPSHGLIKLKQIWIEKKSKWKWV